MLSMLRFFFLLFLFWVPPVLAADGRLKQDNVELFVSTRTPEQISAFYAARGLPPQAVNALAEACFLTVGLHNKRTDKLWLEPAQWQFIDNQGNPVNRITRQEWSARWQSLQVPRGAQATFGWTQLPESRDLYPDESVGGNLTLHPAAGPFTLVARFRTGEEGKGKLLELTVKNLVCPIPVKQP